jgi:hypothetical protein
MKESPFSGMGSGSNQPSGDSGGIHSVTEKKYGGSKMGTRADKSHPAPGGKTQGPSGDCGVSDWNPGR